MEVEIAAATEADVDEMVGLHLSSWYSAHSGTFPRERLMLGPDEDRRREEWLRWFSSADRPARATWLARSGWSVAGFVSADAAEDEDLDPERVGDVYELYVLPEYWGQGVGKALLRTATRHLAEHLFVEAVLWVLEKNARARSFYERHGWFLDGATEYVEWLGAGKVRYRRRL